MINLPPRYKNTRLRVSKAANENETKIIAVPSSAEGRDDGLN